MYREHKEKAGTWVIHTELKTPDNVNSAHMDNNVAGMSLDRSATHLAAYVRHGPIYMVNLQFYLKVIRAPPRPRFREGAPVHHPLHPGVIKCITP